MVKRAPSWCLLAALSLAACRSDPRCKPIEHCDVREPKCQADALAQASCLRGRDEATEPVQVEVVSAEEYERRLLQELEANPETDEQAQVRRGLALFGLAEEPDDPVEDVRDRVDALGGTFDPDEERVVLIDHGDGMTTTLVHEMVHVLQHRAGDLAVADLARTFDDHSAASALIEGEATIWTDEAWTEGFDYSFKDIDYARSLKSYRGWSWSRMEQASSPIETAYSAFSYAFGASYLWPLVQREGAAAVADAFADPPHSSYAVLEADPWSPDLRPNDLGESALPELELTLVGTLHLGSFLFEVLSTQDEPAIALRPWFPESDSFVADTFSVFADERGDVLVSWRIRLDDSYNAEEVAAEVAEDNPGLRVGFKEQDLWLIAAERDELIENLPEELTWTAGPDLDFGFEGSAKPPATRRILCPLRPSHGTAQGPSAR